MSEASVHIVQRGSCWFRVHAQAALIRLSDGDVVLTAGGVGHTLCDVPDRATAPLRSVLAEMPKRLERLTAAQRRETTVILCAKYLFQHRGPHPLISLLPPFIHLPAHQAGAHGQLQLLLQLLRVEATAVGSGSELVVPRLVDTLLVFIIRAWLDGQSAGADGWFGALRDPAIAKALSLIHEQPATPWSLASLATQVAQSRATFARRFAELVGEPPVAYLTRWRMLLAAKILTETDRSLDEIAQATGYETASAFSKAFRRHHGCAPGQFRLRSKEVA